jgi:hypothetical protein
MVLLARNSLLQRFLITIKLWKIAWVYVFIVHQFDIRYDAEYLSGKNEGASPPGLCQDHL